MVDLFLDYGCALITGFISGIVVMRLYIRRVAKRNKAEFMEDLIEEIKNMPTEIPQDDMILNAIDNNIDVLVMHHGEKVEILSRTTFVSCRIEGEVIMLPTSCLVKCDSEKSKPNL